MKKYLSLGALLFVLWIPSESYAFMLNAHINENNLEVIGGDRLYFDVSLSYPSNDTEKDIHLKYDISHGSTSVASSNSIRSILNEASFSDFIVVPKRTESGVHNLAVAASYNGSHESTSASFTVYRGLDKITLFFYVMLLSFIFVAALIGYQMRLIKRLVAQRTA